MPVTIQGIVGPQQLSPGVESAVRLDKTASQVFVQGGSKYGEDGYNNVLFTGSTGATGVAVPIFSSTTQQCVLFNPVSSKKILELLYCHIGYISGTDVAGHFCYAVQTTFTNAVTGTGQAIISSQLATTGSVASFFTAATVTAFSYLRPMGVSQDVQAATATNAPWTQGDEINGTIQRPPGGALAGAANVAAFVTAAISLIWKEKAI
ncbi:MAG: hypothetical protein KGL39_29700 [Patescibacteria group bacterium]|nr:hypothetical protein [Patescibacteria group bacterium]